MKKQLFPPALEWFSILLLVNSEIFKLSLNLSLMHLKAQSNCYEWKWYLSPVILKEMFHEIHKDLYGKPFKRDWVVKVVFLIQTLPTFGAIAITTFEIHRWTFYWVPNNYFSYALSAHANKIFQKWTVFMFTKSWSHDHLMQKAYHVSMMRCIKSLSAVELHFF